MVYEAFVHDMVRIYRILPSKFKLRLWYIFFIQFMLACLETCTILVLSFYGMSLASADSGKSNLMVQAMFSIAPPLKEMTADPRAFVAFASFLVILFIILKNVTAYFAFRKTSRFAENISLYISEETLWRYLNKDYFWHISPSSGNVMQRLNFRDSLTNLLLSLLLLYSNVFCCVALFTSLFLSEPTLTLIVMGVLGTVCTITYLALRRKIDRSGQLVLSSNTQLSQALAGITRGIREVLIYRQQKVFFEGLSQSMKHGLPGRVFLAFSGQAPAWFLEVAGFSTICGVTIALIVQGDPMPDIVKAASMLMLTAWRVLPAVNRVMSYAVNIRGQRAQAMNCLELLETFIQEAPEPLPEPDPNFKFERTIALKDTSFIYPAGQSECLSGLSLEIKKGESVGLIGASGAGKSTLALLLSGLVPPLAGQMIVDGQPLTPEGRAAYTQKVGFVPQNPLLMPGTVADNVAFSRWGQEYDLSKVEEACRMAAMDFIKAGPEGVLMRIGDGGGGLSGGQAQRVSIARALFTSPDIIIFDEATSALDQASENLIKRTIEELKGEITTIIIAHRLTTVENCDVLFWLDSGRIKESGPPSTILPRYLAYMNCQPNQTDQDASTGASSH